QHIPMVAGTDYFAGISLHRELELFVDGGLTPAEALRDATIVPAKVMKVGNKTGSIAAGKVADLVVVDGDPLKSISDVRKTVMTFRGALGYPAKEPYQAVGVASWCPRGRSLPSRRRASASSASSGSTPGSMPSSPSPPSRRWNRRARRRPRSRRGAPAGRST